MTKDEKAASTPAPDDVREQMKQALERKKTKSAQGTSHEEGGSKAQPSHENTTVHREFRRKSG
jgi:hypothetical protein